MRNRKTPAEKLALLEQQRAQLETRIQREKVKARSEDRKKDTRRKIIAGALALEHAGIDPAFDEALKRLLHRYVIRPDDRALFDLPPVSAEKPAPANDSTAPSLRSTHEGH